MRYDASFGFEVEGVHCSTASGLSPGPVFLNYCFPSELPVPASQPESRSSGPLLPRSPFWRLFSPPIFFHGAPSVRLGAPRKEPGPRWLFHAFTIPGLYSVGYFGRGGQREIPIGRQKRSAEEEAPRCVSMFTRRNKRRRRRRGRCHRRAVISYYFGPL